MSRFLVPVLALAPAAFAQVFTYECNVLPPEGGWDLGVAFCNPEEWVEGGLLVQHVEPQCEPQGASISYSRYVTDFIGEERFFVEWRMMTDGSSEEFAATAPAALVVGGQTSVMYHFTISRDLVRFIRDVALPYVYADVAPGQMHTYRLEHYGAEFYVWYVDGVLVDSGVPEGFYPSNASNIVGFRSKSWHLENTSTWTYIRLGRIPDDFSGDYDSSGSLTVADLYFFEECIGERGNGPDIPTDVGCEWTDMDADGDVDFADFGAFQRVFTGSIP